MSNLHIQSVMNIVTSCVPHNTNPAQQQQREQQQSLLHLHPSIITSPYNNSNSGSSMRSNKKRMSLKRSAFFFFSSAHPQLEMEHAEEEEEKVEHQEEQEPEREERLPLVEIAHIAATRGAADLSSFRDSSNPSPTTVGSKGGAHIDYVRQRQQPFRYNYYCDNNKATTRSVSPSSCLTGSSNKSVKTKNKKIFRKVRFPVDENDCLDSTVAVQVQTYDRPSPECISDMFWDRAEMAEMLQNYRQVGARYATERRDLVESIHLLFSPEEEEKGERVGNNNSQFFSSSSAPPTTSSNVREAEEEEEAIYEAINRLARSESRGLERRMCTFIKKNRKHHIREVLQIQAALSTSSKFSPLISRNSDEKNSNINNAALETYYINRRQAVLSRRSKQLTRRSSHFAIQMAQGDARQAREHSWILAAANDNNNNGDGDGDDDASFIMLKQ